MKPLFKAALSSLLLTSPLFANYESPFGSLVGTITSGGSGPLWLTFNGTTGYVTNRGDGLNPDNSVGIFDISTALNPIFKGTVFSGGSGPLQISILGTTAYVANAFDNSIGILDVSMPGTATFKGTIFAGDIEPFDMLFYGTTGYVTCDDYVGIFDVTIPGTASFIGTVSAGEDVYPYWIKNSGTTAFVASRIGSSVGILDISIPGSATLKGTIFGGADQGYLFVNATTSTGYIAYGSPTSSLSYFDIPVPGSATYLGSIPLGLGSDPFWIAVNGTTMLVSDISNLNSDSLLSVIDINLPQSPSLTGHVSSGGAGPGYISIQGTIAYVSNLLSQNISYLNMSVPGTVQLQGTIPSGGLGTLFLEATDSALYVNNNFSNNLGYLTLNYTPPPPPQPTNLPSFPGNAGVTANILNTLNGSGPSNIQAIFNELTGLSYNQQLYDLNQLTPRFKVIQYAQEKLDLLIHKELESALYSNKIGTDLFVLGGYDNLSQKKSNLYTGYNVDSYYQLFGVSCNSKKVNSVYGIGASESFMKLHPNHARAKYNTVWGTLGVANHSSKWKVGIDGLFGYSFLRTKRDMQFLNETAKSKHGAWNASIDGHVSYTKKFTKFSFSPYENLSYIYGVENNYQEYRSSANFYVKNENISILRNALGFSFQSIKEKGLTVFIDGAWVYEYYLKNTNYKAAFTGTDVFGTYKQLQPTRNYGRVSAGLFRSYKHFEWRLAYTGLYGKKFYENAGSIKLSYKF